MNNFVLDVTDDETFLEEVKNKDYIPDPQKINLLSKENLMKETKIILSIMYEKNFK